MIDYIARLFGSEWKNRAYDERQKVRDLEEREQIFIQANDVLRIRIKELEEIIESLTIVRTSVSLENVELTEEQLIQLIGLSD